MNIKLKPDHCLSFRQGMLSMTPIMHMQHRTKQKHNMCATCTYATEWTQYNHIVVFGYLGFFMEYTLLRKLYNSKHCLQKGTVFVFYCFVSHLDQGNHFYMEFFYLFPCLNCHIEHCQVFHEAILAIFPL